MWDQQWETIDSEADIVIRIKQNGYGRLYKHKCCNKGALQYACYGYGRAKLMIPGCRQQAGRCTPLHRALSFIVLLPLPASNIDEDLHSTSPDQ